MEASKFVLRSKTVIANGAVLGAVMLLSLVDSQANGSGEFSFTQKYLPEDWQQYALALQAIGNIALRYFTKNGIRLTPKKNPRTGVRLYVPAFLALAGIAHAKEPELVVTATEPQIPGQRLIIDATDTVADQVEFVIWAEGLASGRPGFEQLAAEIDRLRELGAEVTLPVTPDGEGYVSRFEVGGDAVNLLVLDSTAGAHYRISVTAFTAGTAEDPGGRKSLKIERRIPGAAPVPPAPTPTPVPPGPAPTPPAPTPPAPTPPAPTPPPAPTIPDGRFKVGQRIYGWASSVNSSNRKDDAQKIARVMQDVANRIKGGQVAGNSGIRQSLVDGMRQALDPQALANWIAFGEQLARLIVEFLAAGKLQTPQDWVDFLVEIANALVLVL